MVNHAVVRGVAGSLSLLQDVFRSVSILLGLLQSVTGGGWLAVAAMLAALLVTAGVALCSRWEPPVDRTGQGYGPPAGGRTGPALTRDRLRRL